MLFRREVNVETGIEEVIERIAYRNSDDDVIVLDKNQNPPRGYEKFDPEQVEEEEKPV